MDKINLDISKYSQNELKDIFNIQNISNLQQIETHINKYKNNIFADETLSLGEKDNIINFLNNVIGKLAESLDKTSIFSNSFSNYCSVSNNLVNGPTLDHPIIKNPSSIAGIDAKSYEGKNVDLKVFPPGYINPINIRTIKKTVNVDTRFRDPYYATQSTDFNVTLPESFKKVLSMRLSSLELPLSIYAVNRKLGNNCFTIDTSNIVLDSGNFSNKNKLSNDDKFYDESIITHINDRVSSSSISDISFSIDKKTGKTNISNTGSSSRTIYFNKDFHGNNDLDTPLPLKLGWMLGFRSGSYEINNGESLISEGISAVTGPKYIYICVNDYTNAGNNNYVAAFSSSTLSPHILARINYSALVNRSGGSYVFAEDDINSDLMNRTREYFGPVDIRKLHFQILDEYGRVVDLNNMDWSCALTFDVLYD
uniref:Uncharacterized protein n=1 Tax=viral metagenome TaxID=1070528 RepID=A0A6C0AYS6_9ZZZZ|tara:strand:- start:13862 stop:15133 length:1272 start_codon:yes stop_codon:yes gene_type:complete